MPVINRAYSDHSHLRLVVWGPRFVLGLSPVTQDWDEFQNGLVQSFEQEPSRGQSEDQATQPVRDVRLPFRFEARRRTELPFRCAHAAMQSCRKVGRPAVENRYAPIFIGPGNRLGRPTCDQRWDAAATLERSDHGSECHAKMRSWSSAFPGGIAVSAWDRHSGRGD